MNWITFTMLAALANSGVVLLWKHAAQRPDVLGIVGLNTILSGIMLLGYVTFIQKIKVVPDGAFYLTAGAMGSFAFLSIVLFSMALKQGNVSLASPIFSGVMNVAIVAAGLLFMAEKISLIAALGVAVTLGGVCMIALG